MIGGMVGQIRRGSRIQMHKDKYTDRQKSGINGQTLGFADHSATTNMEWYLNHTQYLKKMEFLGY